VLALELHGRCETSSLHVVLVHGAHRRYAATGARRGSMWHVIRGRRAQGRSEFSASWAVLSVSIASSACTSSTALSHPSVSAAKQSQESAEESSDHDRLRRCRGRKGARPAQT